jgi:hydrogenase nickel incorporation protein HypA/HybF
MHELSLAQDIIEQISERVDGAKVVRVILEIGKLSLVLPDALRFSFEICAEGSLLEGATLEIQEVPGRARCLQCQAEIFLDKAFGECSCGSFDLVHLSGDELKIVAVEVLLCA